MISTVKTTCGHEEYVLGKKNNNFKHMKSKFNLI